MKKLIQTFNSLLKSKKADGDRIQSDIGIEKRNERDRKIGRIRKVQYKNKEILIVDFSDCKETEMINTGTESRNLIVNENRKVLLLNIFNEKNYGTPNFMRHAEKINAEIAKLIDKQAVIGLNKIKLTILKGLNLSVNQNIKAFESIDEAFEYLVDGNAMNN